MLEQLKKSVEYKISALIFAAVLAACLVNTFHGVSSTTKALAKGAEIEIANSVAAAKQRLESSLNLVAADLKVLLKVPGTEGLFRSLDNYDIDPTDGSTSDQWKARQTDFFKALRLHSFSPSPQHMWAISLRQKNGAS